MAGNTPNLNLYLPGGGSTGIWTPDEVADIDKLNQNFLGLDTEVGPAATNTGNSLRARLLRLEEGGTGTTRDTVFGVPGDAASRVALANRRIRWFNWDKQLWETYYAQFDDAGVTAITPVRKTPGWKPVPGRQAISAFTVAGVPTAANVKKYGATIEVTGAVTNIRVDGCFTADFDAYEILYEIWGVSAGLALNLQLRKAGASTGGTAYTTQRLGANGATVTGVRDTSTVSHVFGAANPTEGALFRQIITNPVSLEWKRFETTGGLGTELYTSSAVMKDNTAHDGFDLSTGSANTINRAFIRIFGISNGF